MCLCTGLVHFAYVLNSFFFNETATTEIYTLSLHDALPISPRGRARESHAPRWDDPGDERFRHVRLRWIVPDRKSTRLNSSHEWISYAVFCLKKKKHDKHAGTRRKNVNSRTRRRLVLLPQQQ